MATGTTDNATAGRAGQRQNIKYYIISYPLVSLTVFFLVPLAMLVVFSFYQNVSGGYYEAAFTVENYTRFFTSNLYLGRLRFTLWLSFVTTVGCLALGYPLAYYLARLRNALIRRVLMIAVISTLWITYVIRAYAWDVMLSRNGIVSTLAVAVGIFDAPRSFVPGFGALTVGMIYVFLPFMVLTLYSSLKNIDTSLLEASKNLGAGPIETFRRVTLPLSMNGVVSGSVLVFILSLGSYVLPAVLGNPAQYTLPVIIGNEVSNSNVPFGAAMSIVLLVVVVGILFVTVRVTNVSAADLGGRADE